MDDRHLPIAPLWKTYGTKVPYGSGYGLDRKSTRLNSSHSQISYAVFCLKKKKTNAIDRGTRPKVLDVEIAAAAWRSCVDGDGWKPSCFGFRYCMHFHGCDCAIAVYFAEL